VDLGIGGRVSQLRKARGLSQSGLAAGRFSKEYVSQIERGKAHPSEETLAWLAEQLGVDAEYLETGLSADERGRIEVALAEAERLSEDGRYSEALTAFEREGGSEAVSRSRELRLRLLLGEAWARIQTGQVDRAVELLEEAEGLVGDGLGRAEVLFRRGVCSYRSSEIAEATGLLSEALARAEASDLPCDRLRVEILGWRSRCYRRERDFVAAREDVEQALELAEGIGDTRGLANALSQAAIVAEREGRLVFARSCAERAIALYQELDDQANVARMLNDLGVLNLQLARPEDALELFERSRRVALVEGSDANAALALGSLAEAHLRAGDNLAAEGEARRALELFAGRVDYLHAIGVAQLTLGRALLEQNHPNEAEEMLIAAENSFEQLSSVSHQAAAWVARGDLAQRRGDPGEAARLYRRAAEALRQTQS
jgi:tetratricopeptide (TPR) repeat protein